MKRRVFGDDAEWLEADGLGGFASGTVSGIRTRRYHALLCVARTPPTDRFVLVNGLEVWAKPAGSDEEFPLSAQRYEPGVVSPVGFRWLESFSTEPWPTWIYKLDDRTRIEQSICVPRGYGACVIRWRILSKNKQVKLRIRPLLSVRNYHHLHHENGSFDFLGRPDGQAIVWQPYWGTPCVRMLTNGAYRHDPVWYRSFLYVLEAARGLDAIEDLASPGEVVIDLGQGVVRSDAQNDRSQTPVSDQAWLIFSSNTPGTKDLPKGDAQTVGQALLEYEAARRDKQGTGLARSAESYLVKRGLACSIIAGYPWFTDWGRDTFIAMRGLCLATGRLEEACRILVEWSRAQIDGLFPNRFADAGSEPEFNSVDAALWYVQAAHDFLTLARKSDTYQLAAGDERIIRRACVRALKAYAKGTTHSIAMDKDGLLGCGQGDSSLTWMDARVNGKAVTPRVGKPVEVQALWINALLLARQDDPSFGAMAEQALDSFGKRFWNDKAGCLYDVIDVDHVPGRLDDRLRPNQLLAVGGLSHQLIEGQRAKKIVQRCQDTLLTPMGLRTLDPDHPDYVGSYIGDALHRDSAYHNGTVWPWLIGPFVHAWWRVQCATRSSKNKRAALAAEARQRFLEPLMTSCMRDGLGHIAEIADGDAPHAARGCPFQAWSVGELLRLENLLGTTGKA